MRVEVHPDPEALAIATAGHVVDWLGDPENTTIGLAGGSTPRRAYELLREADVAWSRVTGWMTDERHVPVDHPDSNAGMASAALFDHVPAHLAVIDHQGDPAAAAAEYRGRLNELLAADAGLVMLGMGDDGHTASLFPGTAALGEQSLSYVANWLPDRETWRLTATFPLIAQARCTLFVVAGVAKAERVAEVLSATSTLPAAIASRVSADPLWLLDEAAASRLGG